MQHHKFSVEDMKYLMKSIVVLVDSQEKKNSHVLDNSTKNGIAYQTTKLDYDDYIEVAENSRNELLSTAPRKERYHGENARE